MEITSKKSAPYFIASLLVIGIWKLFTMTSSYAWFPNGNEIKILDKELLTIFLFHSLLWLFVINLSVFFIHSILRRRPIALIVSSTMIAFSFIMFKPMIDKKVAKSYFIVFKNQSVSEEYINSPIKEAGFHIGPFLNEYIKNKKSEYRIYAIIGISDINYTPATTTLKQILFDSTEQVVFRAEAYRVLSNFNTNEAMNIIKAFKTSSTSKESQEVISLGDYFLANKE